MLSSVQSTATVENHSNHRIIFKHQGSSISSQFLARRGKRAEATGVLRGLSLPYILPTLPSLILGQLSFTTHTHVCQGDFFPHCLVSECAKVTQKHFNIRKEKMNQEGKLVAIISTQILKSNLLPQAVISCRNFPALKSVGVRGIDEKGWGDDWIM